FTDRALGRALGTGTVASLTLALNPSQRVTTLTVTRPNGTSTSLTGSQVEVKLGLRSTFFRIDRVAIDAPKQRPLTGKRFILTGSAIRGGATLLYYRNGNATTWTSMGRVRVRAGGGWVAAARIPKGIRTRYFKLVRDGVDGPSVGVRARLR